MLIECITMRAAADVVCLLLGAHLRPGRTFRLTGSYLPIHITLSAAPPAHLVAQLRAIPDTTIVNQDAT